MTKRACQRARQNGRQVSPTSINDALLHEHIPTEFLVQDVYSDDGKARHIILTLPRQLKALGKRKIWKMDGTFYVSTYHMQG